MSLCWKLCGDEILCPKCGSPLCYCRCAPNPDWVEAERELLVADLKGSRVERGTKELEAFVEKYRNAPRYRDRISGCPLEGLKAFVVGMSKPPWWRFLARWKWRKMARNIGRPQQALRNWVRLASAEELNAAYDAARAGDQETKKEETK